MNIENLTEQEQLELELTAYALGELKGSAKEAMARKLEANPELLKEVETIRAFGSQLASELKSEPGESLSEVQREKIEASMELSSSHARSRRNVNVGWMALVASVVISLAVWKMERTHRGSELAVANGISVTLPSPIPALSPPAESRLEAPMTASNESNLMVGQVVEQRSLDLPQSAPSAPTAPSSVASGYVGKAEVMKSKTQTVFAERKQTRSGGGIVGGSEYGFVVADRARKDADSNFNSESYARIEERTFQKSQETPLSTFSIDIDTASYANVRRMIEGGSRPPKDAVRIEELVNYFNYSYPQPEGAHPFSVTTEITDCPWKKEHQLMRIGLKGREIKVKDRPNANLVFLIDVSGSMDAPNKLPLVRFGMKTLVEQLKPEDRVAIAVYAGASGLALPSTLVENRREILKALNELTPGGSTNGAMGIQLAYDIAKANFIPGGINRVILCTDGDFNVGMTDEGALTRLIEEKAKSGVFLSVFGFGMGNYKDSTLEKLADKGNGNYGYIDSEKEAQRSFVQRLSGTLQTIAKDVKIQIEFNPDRIAGYRLIGYENRALAARDFNDDRKDAGEIGAGHTVTALYELIPAGKSAGAPEIDPLKYQSTSEKKKVVAFSEELMTVKLRYKQPEGSESSLLTVPIRAGQEKSWDRASGDTRFAAAVAAFGMVLRDSPDRGEATLTKAREWAESSLGQRQEDRQEFMELVKKAEDLVGRGR